MHVMYVVTAAFSIRRETFLILWTQMTQVLLPKAPHQIKDMV